MSREIELKLEVARDDAEQLMRQPWLHPAECRSARQVSTYFDTSDNALRRRGYTLRVRQSGDRFIQTVKSLGEGAGLFDRGEWEYQIDGSAPDAEKLCHTPLADLDTDLLGPVVCSDVVRTSCRVKLDGADIELDADLGRISAGARSAPLSEVEIELRRGDAAALVSLARRIASQAPVKLGVLTKAERGFALADARLGKVTKAEPVAIRPEMTVAQGFEAIVNGCIRHFRLNEDLVIEKRTPEALHQARVAMRRLRAGLSLFRSAIMDSEFPRLRDELRWFTGELGDARNLDVFLQRELPPDQRRQLTENREAAYDRVIAALDSTRFRTLMLDLVTWAALGPWHDHANAGLPIEPYVNRRIDRLWNRISAADHLTRMDEEERHELRILIKKIRYALEFVHALHAHEGQRQKKFARALEDLQETLGLLNDAAVARTMVASDAWPILPEEQGEEEMELLRHADHALDRLHKVGPYWR